MKRTTLSLLPAVAGLAAIAATILVSAESPPAGFQPKYRVTAPQVNRGETLATPTPTPTPRPVPYSGPVASLYLGSARISASAPVEVRDTVNVGGQETFQDPTRPERIAWYSRFGQPGFPANNSIFAGHINYIGHGNGPFAYLTSAAYDDALYVTMANGQQYAYTVRSVEIVSLAELQSGAMDAYVFPALASNTERITLISCGGNFVARAGGGGDYTSRVILVAERYVD
jgi:hypothetical protein